VRAGTAVSHGTSWCDTGLAAGRAAADGGRTAQPARALGACGEAAVAEDARRAVDLHRVEPFDAALLDLQEDM
jgi:hypothetical protein